MNYSEDAERYVLGCMLLDNSCIPLAINELKDEYFYFQNYRTIFSAIKETSNKGLVVDALVLLNRYPALNPATVAGLSDEVSTSSNIGYYIDELKQLFIVRNATVTMIRGLEKLKRFNVGVGNVYNVVNETNDNLVKLNANNTSQNFTTSEGLARQLVKDMEDTYKKKELFLGLETGYNSLDRMLDGLPYDTFITVGARPSIGKTAFALNLMEKICSIKKDGKQNACAFFSLEMTVKSLGYRLLAIKSGIKQYFIRHGMIDVASAMFPRLDKAISDIYKSKLYMFDSNSCGDINYIDNLIAQIRMLANKGVKVFFIDHIGLVKHRNEKLKRYEQVNDITFSLHKLAQQLKVIIIGLCQLNRDAENKKPTLANLRESGDIEQNSDVCIFLHRDRGQGEEERIPTEVIVAKSRDGATGVLKFDFLPKLTKFEDMGDGYGN